VKGRKRQAPLCAPVLPSHGHHRQRQFQDMPAAGRGHSTAMNMPSVMPFASHVSLRRARRPRR